MLKQQIEKAINEQINAETYSAYLYWAMSAYFETINLKGFANWMAVQAQEELTHAAKFYRYVNERGGRVKLTAIEAPAVEWESPLAVFKEAYTHECHVTNLINKLVDLSLAESDHATHNFLQWFVAEQVEEEASADEVVQQLELVGGQGHGLLMVDRELATRTFVMPMAEGE